MSAGAKSQRNVTERAKEEAAQVGAVRLKDGEERSIRRRCIGMDSSLGITPKYSFEKRSHRRKSHSSGIQAPLNLWHRPENDGRGGG